MFYKASNTIGIRKKFGDCNTAFSYGGKKCELTEEVMRGFADEVLQKLDAGQTEKAVKSWVDKAIAR